MPRHPQTIRSRGYLPHWEAPGASYFITFRLADSLPQNILKRYQRERQSIIDTAAQMNRELTTMERNRLTQLFSNRIETHLDQGIGECHLRHPLVGKLVFDAIQYFHATRYMLHTCCIMPNHVHALFTPTSPHTLDGIVHSWKSFTAHRANEILKRTGPFWMPEYYDHMIRDKDDFAHAHRYILNNPKKAGLDNWPWIANLVPSESDRDGRVT